MNANQISQSFLSDVKMGNPTEQWQQAIAGLTAIELEQALVSQENRLAFWLNLYNAFFQVVIREHPEWFKNKMKLFFGRHFTVANRKMSLDDIEHDMLRKSTYKWSLGYLQKPFPSAFEKAYQVKTLDPRIHFALNCGAVSCPPIRFYTSENVQEQLKTATLNYLLQDCKYEPTQNTLYVSSLMNWFRGDFGGINGIKAFLKQYNVLPDASAKIKFNPYNWTVQLEHYAE
jgi:hypothetical protein